MKSGLPDRLAPRMPVRIRAQAREGRGALDIKEKHQNWCYIDVMRALTVRLAEGIHDELQKAAAEMGVSINDLVEEAVTARLDDRTVTLTTRNANDAARLRRLAREHGSLGAPFPNNDSRMASWKVCEAVGGGWQPVEYGAVPSVGTDVKSVFGGEVECGYPLGHATGRRGLCPRCGG